MRSHEIQVNFRLRKCWTIQRENETEIGEIVKMHISLWHDLGDVTKAELPFYCDFAAKYDIKVHTVHEDRIKWPMCCWLKDIMVNIFWSLRRLGQFAEPSRPNFARFVFYTFEYYSNSQFNQTKPIPNYVRYKKEHLYFFPLSIWIFVFQIFNTNNMINMLQ